MWVRVRGSGRGCGRGCEGVDEGVGEGARVWTRVWVRPHNEDPVPINRRYGCGLY